MKPIFMFAIAAIAAAGIGAGSLNNTIDLNLQQFGVGAEDIVSPITAANVNFEIEAIQGDGELKNLITICQFHSDETIEDEATIICKLTDIDSKVIAEGRVVLDTGYDASVTIPIVIDQFAFESANDVRNVHDVTLVVLGGSVPAPVVEEPPL